MRPANVVMVLVGVLAWTNVVLEPTAHAANPAVEGRKHARKANHLADTNKCKQAIPEYTKALRLLKDPALLFNRAECYRRTGDATRAVVDYRKFLAELPAAPNRAQVEGQIAALDRSGTKSAASAAGKAVAARPPTPRAGGAPSLPPPLSAVAVDTPERAEPEREPEIAEPDPSTREERRASSAPGAPAPVEREAPMALVDLSTKPAAPAAESDAWQSRWWVWVVGAVVIAGGVAGTYFALKQGKTDIPASDLGNYKF